MAPTCDTVYVVDPDESVHDALGTLLQSAAVRVEGFHTPEAFLNCCASRSTENCCVLVEADLSGIGSLELIRTIREQQSNVPIIVLSSTVDDDIAAQALKAGAVDVIDKPLSGVNLLDRILGVTAGARLNTSS